MTIFEYLVEKYGETGPKVVTRTEARHFGIAYPLQTGWLTKHGDQDIGRDVAAALADKLYTKGLKSGSVSKSNYCLAGAAILRRISLK